MALQTALSESKPDSKPYRHSYAVPQAGVYTPAVTFFDPDTDQIRWPEQAKYFNYLYRSGLTGLVVLGSNAEAFLLTRDERRQLLLTARKVVGPNYPIIAGVGGHSTAQVLEYIRDAYDAGATYALVLPCAYFGKATTPEVVKAFYADVARDSPLPIIIYNFPGVCNGLDLDSETITQLARAHAKIVGVKLTCGSVAKIHALSATFSPHRFAVFGGQSDFLVGALAAGSAGCVCAFGNVFPRTIVKIFKLWEAGRYEEAKRLQSFISLAESSGKASAVAGTKYAAAVFSATKCGISEADAVRYLRPRKPYIEISDAVKTKIREGMERCNELEVELANQGASRL